MSSPCGKYSDSEYLVMLGSHTVAYKYSNSNTYLNSTKIFSEDIFYVVNIWASWCPPCQAEHPILMDLAEEGVKIYGINYRDTPQDARIFLEMLGNPYTKIGADIQGRVAIEWGVYGYPETFVGDQTGRIRYRHVGPINPGQLNSVIRPILNKVSR